LAFLILASFHDHGFTNIEYRSLERNEAKPFDQIPGDKPWPLIGTLWQFFPFVGMDREPKILPSLMFGWS
jgi:hypothetical protein